MNIRCRSHRLLKKQQTQGHGTEYGAALARERTGTLGHRICTYSDISIPNSDAIPIKISHCSYLSNLLTEYRYNKPCTFPQSLGLHKSFPPFGAHIQFLRCRKPHYLSLQKYQLIEKHPLLKLLDPIRHRVK